MAFHEVRFPDNISRGARGGPERRTQIARPPAETVAAVPPDWADWIADLDDRMTGTCR